MYCLLVSGSYSNTRVSLPVTNSFIQSRPSVKIYERIYSQMVVKRERFCSTVNSLGTIFAYSLHTALNLHVISQRMCHMFSSPAIILKFIRRVRGNAHMFTVSGTFAGVGAMMRIIFEQFTSFLKPLNSLECRMYVFLEKLSFPYICTSFR